MTLGELSQRMMVSNGNITGLVERLVAPGHARPPARAERPPRPGGAPDRPGPRASSAPWRREHEDWIARDVRGSARRRDRDADAAAGQGQDVGAPGDRRGEPQNDADHANPVTAAACGLPGRAHFRFAVEGKVATITLDRPGAQEPAHLRELRRARRHLPRLRQGRGREGGRGHRRRRQFLAPAATCSRSSARWSRWAPTGLHRLHAHDRRAGQGDARLPAADRRRGRRHLRRRRRDRRHGVRHAPRHAAGARSRSCSTASGSPAATWAPARSCRASSARAAPPSCSTPAARWAARRRERWGFFNRLVAPDAVLAEAQALAGRDRRRPDLRQRHDQAHARDGMGDVGRGGDRGRGGGAGAVHDDARISPAPIRAFAAKEKPVFEGN